MIPIPQKLLLTNREHEVLQLRGENIPFNHRGKHSYNTIGEKLGISAGRVREIYNKASRKQERQRLFKSDPYSNIYMGLGIRAIGVLVNAGYADYKRDRTYKVDYHRVKEDLETGFFNPNGNRYMGRKTYNELLEVFDVTLKHVCSIPNTVWIPFDTNGLENRMCPDCRQVFIIVPEELCSADFLKHLSKKVA